MYKQQQEHTKNYYYPLKTNIDYKSYVKRFSKEHFTPLRFWIKTPTILVKPNFKNAIVMMEGMSLSNRDSLVFINHLAHFSCYLNSPCNSHNKPTNMLVLPSLS